MRAAYSSCSALPVGELGQSGCGTLQKNYTSVNLSLTNLPGLESSICCSKNFYSANMWAELPINPMSLFPLPTLKYSFFIPIQGSLFLLLRMQF